MKARILLSIVFIFFVFSGFGKVWIVTNNNYTYSPQTITINAGDTVVFEISSGHNVVEVSQQTWNNNGNTVLPGGFGLPFGGGTLLTASLTAGTHYYVCTPHAYMGMKASIIVQNVTTGIDNSLFTEVSVYPNPVKDFVNIRIAGNKKGEVFSIVNLTGKQVLTGKLEDEINSVDLSGLNSGLYFVQLGTLKRQTLKLIKE
jgi:plastocyanin